MGLFKFVTSMFSRKPVKKMVVSGNPAAVVSRGVPTTSLSERVRHSIVPFAALAAAAVPVSRYSGGFRSDAVIFRSRNPHRPRHLRGKCTRKNAAHRAHHRR